MTYPLDDAYGFDGVETDDMSPEQRAAKTAAEDIELATDDAAWVIIQAALKLFNARRATKGWTPVTLNVPEGSI
jgi:hypothetical protein